ncbi:hypothetical protein C8R47DRAFT_403674 [Mycena vitilis]|nr:hypothetical protein C8R47DRAFT_403674 [Mycena vitilis]
MSKSTAPCYRLIECFLISRGVNSLCFPQVPSARVGPRLRRPFGCSRGMHAILSSQYPYSLTRVAMWPRKRPRKSGGLTISVPPASDTDSSTASTGRSRLDAFTLGAKAVLAACDAPVVGVVKPVAALAVLGCETAQAAMSAKEAEADLAIHAQRMEDTVTERSLDLPSEHQARVHLENALDEIYCYLESKTESSNTHRVLSRLVSAASEMNRLTKMKAQLDDAFMAFKVAAVSLQLDRLQVSMDELHSPQNQITLQKLPSEVIAFVHRMDQATRTTTFIFHFCADAREVLIPHDS